ncbi:3-oxoacyl-ACP reductase [Betaproteobacteria bacterium GR16-43]|nr:3-oxoacyl-ACP reductase [Betaproteobacteria bacterium GR16-43]
MKVALLTAAGSGMGAAAARELSARGWKVAVQSSSGKGEALGKSLGGLGFTGSITDVAALDAMIATTLDQFGRIDAVVNSAPHPPKGELLTISDEDWHKGLDLVFLNVVNVTRRVAPLMEKQGGGAIVNISTFATFEPDLQFPVSGCLRAALASFTKLFADRYALSNVRMNNVLPGYVDSLPEKAERTAKIPMGRYATMEEIAKAVAFLCSDDSTYITGQNLRVDGGLTRSV